MHLSEHVCLIEVSCRVVAPDDLIDWHNHRRCHEFCLILEGAPTVGHRGGKLVPQVDTLFLFVNGEMHGIWNSGSASARLWLLHFHVSPTLRTHFHELFKRPSDQRVLKLSPAQRQWFASACHRLAFERETLGFLNAFAASAWLTLLLVNVTRWLVIDPGSDLTNDKGEIDPQCLELWQKIHRQVFQPTSAGPMLFGLNPGHDSLRHRFRKIFGISPQGMLIRLRIDRAKELLRTSNLSVKEIAHELGYSRQHDLTRAFHKYTGTSPREWKMHAKWQVPERIPVK
ncbi:MAG: AraC family transcriptional regulator [Verrucomicrobia bacterium]|nr:AraC family transcriptional regulator [Verrucomicrobiota bacterium]